MGDAKNETAGKAWYFFHDGVQHGPFDDEELCRAADEGRLKPSDEVWRPDLKVPVAALHIKGLFPEGATPEKTAATEPLGKPRKSPPAPPAANPATAFRASVSKSGSIVCPYCWHSFDPQDFLFIAGHESLRGDPVLGEGESLRFAPTRFTPDGHAIDDGGVRCPDRACPHCHMRFPENLLGLKPLFVSMIGASGSGKSYLLACMTWKMRSTLHEHFDISFTDADPSINTWLHEYERILFMQANRQKLQFIRKTQAVADERHYRDVIIDGMHVLLAMPSMFSLQSDGFQGPGGESRAPVCRTLVMYDNAGEQFQPTFDHANSPGTRHLLHSEALLFLFDPTMDVGFRSTLTGDDIQLKLEKKVDRQDIYFTETINRIRKNLGLDPRERYNRPVVVVVSKADVLGEEMRAHIAHNPWAWNEAAQADALDHNVLLPVSFATRALLKQHAPEAVNAVESFASNVLYVPVSALGHSPTFDRKSSELSIRPADIKPCWAEVPLLCVLHALGYVSRVLRRDESHPAPEHFRVQDGMFHFTVPGTDERVRLPVSHAGASLRDPKTGRWFRVPDLKP